METNSVNIRKSRYSSGGRTEYRPGFIEWWERKELLRGTNDTVYVVEKKFEGRIDMIASLFLDEPRYWWIIAQYNGILDPHAEIVEGRRIYIPSKENVDSILSDTTGGVISTREVAPAILPIV